MSRQQVVDRYFLEHRAKVVDLAAFLDRVDRAAAGSDADDFRLAALRDAIAILIDDRPDRTRRVLERLSDPTDQPVAAADGQAASGAPSGPLATE